MAKDSIITQKDVAERAGVSRGVVSYVINNGPRDVSPETRERVLAAIDELGYRPNKHAQRLKLGDSTAKESLGIIAGGHSYNVLDRPYYNTIIAGLFDEVHRLGQEVRFFSFFDALTDPVFFNKNIHRDEISSLILILPAMIAENPDSQRILDQIAERIDNVVCLEEPMKGWPTVIFDRAAAARQAVEHLVNLGHERIAFLAIQDARLTGYRQTLAEHNLPYDESLVFTPDPSHVLSSAYEAAVEIIKMKPRPTAVFAANDESAISAIAAMHDHGVKVPEDIAIVSIDNIGLAEMVRPSLTTVDVPKRRMAAYAMQVLMMQKQFKGQPAASIALPTELIIRESCGHHLK
ncbi:MAG: LacI family DNA-binding transcriptional regulator [Ardenticatenaceae bacterium]|nr:LacI family DNA-binding transcriptional regulator [Anaerolineales bacterium]MCB8976214.1 LacI family DNA-binding transcriptional regulator [Ardenticatenaceae bacterium]